MAATSVTKLSRPGLLRDGGEQLPGAGEVAVDGPPGDAQRRGDVGQGGVARTPLVDHRAGGVDDPFACLGVVSRWHSAPPFSSHGIDSPRSAERAAPHV